jgi:hypothetical protein
MVKKFPTALAVFFCLCILAGLIFTWPLACHFFTSIPYTLRPLPGFERVPLMPGDHLQTYYWFWLLSDNLFGHSALFTNPYEFNGPLGPMSAVYANFPFSLLYIVLLFLGPVGAYNGLILLSFVLSGLAMFLLARTWTKDFWASLLAGLIFTVVPYRVSHIAGGQLYGYVIFLLPLCLFFVEQILTSGRWVYGAAAGLCLVLMSLMDPHSTYLAALTLGLYLPGRILLIRSVPLTQTRDKNSFWLGLLGALAGSFSISSFLWIRLGKKTGLPFWHPDMLQAFFLGTLFSLLFWFYLSAFFSRLTTLSFAEARQRTGKLFFLFLPLWFYALKYRMDFPRLGLILPLMVFGLFLAFLFAFWMKHRNRFLMFEQQRIRMVIIWVGSGLLIASAYVMQMRRTVFLPSLAGKGRTISEVLLFSPRASNFFFWQDINYERFIFLGWGVVILAVLGMIPLFRNNPKHPGQIALAGIMAFLALILTLGPTLTYFPLYQTLYRYFPFFNYPRVPARFLMVGLIFLCLLVGMALSALREGLASRGWPRLKRVLPVLIIVIVLAELHPWKPLGLSLMSGENLIFNLIDKQLAKGGRVLELPVWPGDSHQSSAYEYTVTRTRKPMINGYAPVVFQDYIQQVFWPLFPLDLGELKAPEAVELKKLKVDLITFHDNSMVYSEKISPFPPRLVLKRLMASPFLKLVDHDQDIFLFRFNSDFPEAPSDPKNPLPPLFKGEGKSPLLTKGEGRESKEVSTITSPVSAVFYANNLPQDTGRYEMDPSASGYYLLMDEKYLNHGQFVPRPGERGNVAMAIPGQDHPGYLAVGPNRYFPSGKYRARFRLKAGFAGFEQEVGRVEVIEGRTRVVAQKILRGCDFLQAGTWRDIPLEFEISQISELGFRVFFSGNVPLTFSVAIIGFADQNTGSGSVEAEDLLRQTGTVVSDPLASGKEAVLGKGGFHPPIYLCYGPYRTFEPGRYRAKFFIRLKGLVRISPKEEVALLEVATDMGKHIFGKQKVMIQDLSPDEYRPVELVFQIPFRCELGYRVKFLGKADLLIDRMEVVDSQLGEGER